MTTWGQGPRIVREVKNLATGDHTEVIQTTDERLATLENKLTLVEHQLTQINDAITELLKTIPLPK